MGIPGAERRRLCFGSAKQAMQDVVRYTDALVFWEQVIFQ